MANEPPSPWVKSIVRLTREATQNGANYPHLSGQMTATQWPPPVSRGETFAIARRSRARISWARKWPACVGFSWKELMAYGSRADPIATSGAPRRNNRPLKLESGARAKLFLRRHRFANAVYSTIQ